MRLAVGSKKIVRTKDSVKRLRLAEVESRRGELGSALARLNARLAPELRSFAILIGCAPDDREVVEGESREWKTKAEQRTLKPKAGEQESLSRRSPIRRIHEIF